MSKQKRAQIRTHTHTSSCRGWCGIGGHAAAGDDSVQDPAVEHADAVDSGVDDPAPLGKPLRAKPLGRHQGGPSDVSGYVHYHAGGARPWGERGSVLAWCVQMENDGGGDGRG